MRFGLFGGPSHGDDWGADDQTATVDVLSNPFYSAPDVREATAEAGAILGTPDECIERLRTLEAGGVEQVLFAGASLADLRLFASEVMPAFG